MFTGIVEAIGTVTRKEGSRLTLVRPENFDDLKIGSSVAINGVCLSVIHLTKEEMSFDVIPETFSKTNLGDLQEGSTINLERAMLATARFEGHIVQGHVEATGAVQNVETSSTETRIEILFPEELAPFIIPKGSITLNGVSLTIASVAKKTLTVALIPLTLTETTFGMLKIGDRVNMETDMLVRAILQKK